MLREEQEAREKPGRLTYFKAEIVANQDAAGGCGRLRSRIHGRRTSGINLMMRPGDAALRRLLNNIRGIAAKRPMNGPAGVLAALLMVACGAAAGSASPWPTENLGADFQAFVAPSDTATAGLWGAYTALPTDTAKIRAAAKACFDAEMKLNSQLLAFEKKVPAKVQRDIETARAATSKEIADLQLMTASTTSDQLTVAFDAYAADETTGESALVVLRSDLGLPPPS